MKPLIERIIAIAIVSALWGGAAFLFTYAVISAGWLSGLGLAP